MIKRGVTQLIELVESRVFEVSEQAPKRREQEKKVDGVTLLPPLSDDLVLARIWPRLHQGVNISLLWRLQRVNKAWREKVSTTVEWAALDMVRVDTPGLLQFLADRGEHRPSLRERVENELASFTVLLAEPLESFSNQSEVIQSRDESLRSLKEEKGRDVTKGISRRTEDKRSNGYYTVCREIDSVYPEGSLDNSSDDSYQGEREEIETCVSSSASSLRVYYPRHSVRVG